MRKWVKPIMINLGVEMTMNPPVHSGYCHNTNGDCTGTVKDHADDGAASGKVHGYTGVICETHGPGNEACCCYVQSTGDGDKPSGLES